MDKAELLSILRAERSRAHEDLRYAIRRLARYDNTIRELSPLSTMIRPTERDYQNEALR